MYADVHRLVNRLYFPLLPTYNLWYEQCPNGCELACKTGVPTLWQTYRWPTKETDKRHYSLAPVGIQDTYAVDLLQAKY